MCNECAFVCPHAAIRPFLADEEEMTEAPEGFIVRDLRGADGEVSLSKSQSKIVLAVVFVLKLCPAKGKALVMRPYEEEKSRL